MAPAPPTSRKQPAGPLHRPSQAPSQPEVVDPVWLIKAFAVVVVAALVCGYLTVCLLFYQGQWQLVLHPKRTATLPPSLAGDPIIPIHFAVDESGVPQLVGWWLPAKVGARYAGETILYLPSGDGSLSDAAQRLATLHALGINVFGFDYRGYGQSAETHPNQRRMTEDTLAAWQYLTTARAIPADRIIPYGEGVGGYLALHLAVSETAIRGVIVESPRARLIDVVRADPRTGWLPVRALFHDSFDLSSPLATLKTPKLFLLNDRSPALDLARGAADPKRIVAVPPDGAPAEMDQAYTNYLSGFLDELVR